MLILMDVQYLQYFDFNCENRSNGQNHCLQDFHHPIKYHQATFPILPPLRRILPLPLNTTWKTLKIEWYTPLSKTSKFHVNNNPVIQEI